MTSSNTLRLMGLISLTALLSTTAQAQGDAYYYGGLSVGQSRSSFHDADITNQLLTPGLSTTTISHDHTDTGYKLFLGYQFNTFLGLEGGYFNLGRFGFVSDTSPAGTVEGRLKVQGGNLDLVGTMPLSERWAFLARIGAQYAQSKSSFTGTGAATGLNRQRDDKETNIKVGVGLQYEISPSWLVRGEVERYRINDTVNDHGNVNLYSISMVFPFGRSPAPARRVAEAPAYVAPAPAEAPAPMVFAPPAAAPMAPPPQTLSLSAESAFSFDRSDLRPEGKNALTTFANNLAGAKYTEVVVEGHTDRLGSPAYNQTLSEKRAESVKTYLVSEGHLDAALVSAVGKGESEPVTKAEDCKGNTRTAALVACLQPDRRVDIRVNATR